MLPTVLGASSSNISKTMSPWLVVMVIVDMPNSSFRELEAQGVAPDVGAVDRVGDAGGLVGGHLEQHEALQQADVADRLAVQAGGRHGGDQVRLREPGGAAAGGDQGAVAGVAVDGAVVRLAVASRTALLDLGRRDVRALGPGRDTRVGVLL